jgi:hypothetical protein
MKILFKVYRFKITSGLLMVEKSKNKVVVVTPQIQKDLEEDIDKLNDKRYDLQFEIADKVAALVGVKWDAPTLQKEIEELVRQNYQNWNDIFEAEERSGHEPVKCTFGKGC